MKIKKFLKSNLLLAIAILSSIELNAQQNFSEYVSVFETSANPWPGFNIFSYGGLQNYNPNHHPIFNMIRANGSNSNPTFVRDGDNIGTLGFTGIDDAKNWVQNARISVYALSDYVNGNYANRMDFLLGGNATCCGQARMSIHGVTGNVGIGTTEPGGKLDINLGDWGSITRIVFKSLNDNPGINFYRSTGTAQTAYPWRIEENFGALEFQTGTFSNIGQESLKTSLTINKYNLEIGTGNNTNGERSSIIINGFDNNAKFYGILHSNWEENQRTFDIYTNNQVSQLKIDASANPYGKILLLPGTNANVGIGTLNPTAKLAVSSSVIPESSIAQVDANLVIEAKSTEKAIDKGATLGFVVPSNTDGGNLWQQGRILVASDKMDNYNADGRMYIQTRFFNLANNTWDWSNNLVLRASGNVGIGTENPSEKLQIGNEFTFHSGGHDIIGFGFTPSNSIDLNANAHSAEIRFKKTEGTLALGVSQDNASNPTPAIEIWKNNNVTLSYYNWGKVGIGTNNPDEKLTVNGKIHAKEVKIDLNIAPDYVFEKYYTGFSNLNNAYKMPTLDEVETFTKEHHHLPEVPSAQEIKENGLEVGEMNKILLQKVEELTLYLIEQKKEIEALKTKVNELSKE